MAKKLTLESLNVQLKAGSTGVRVEERGGRLSLKATLPPRSPGGAVVRRIALGIHNNEWGLEEAKEQALKLASQLAGRSFEWALWDKVVESPGDADSCKDWLERYKEFIVATKISTTDPDEQDLRWRRGWFNMALKWLPMDKILNEESLVVAATHYPKEQKRSRQRSIQILTAFALWCGVEANLKPYDVHYSVKDVVRNIPTRAVVETAIDQIKNSRWKRVAALMATYGLRDHEVWYVELAWVDGILEGSIVDREDRTAKTGTRDIIAPIYKEWISRWDLDKDGEIPKLKTKTNSEYGDRTAKAFRRNSIPFAPYSLRHFYAVNWSVEKGIAHQVTAAMLGHSAEVHTKIYNKHISADQKRSTYRKGY